ncbi:cytochrome P450 2J2-like [Guaruba guarouba]
MELQFWPGLVSPLEKLNVWMLLVVLVTFLLIIDLVKKRRPRNFPPGPQLFPLVGTIVDLRQPLHLVLLKGVEGCRGDINAIKGHRLMNSLFQLTARYGNIFSVQFGSLTFVVLNGYQMVREAFVHQAEIFTDRPNIPLLQEIFRGFAAYSSRDRVWCSCLQLCQQRDSTHRLISSNGPIWRQQRKFTLATLKSLAGSFEEKVQEESRYLVETIEEEKGQPFDPHYKINSAVSNIICSITFGNRFDYHDNRFQELLHSLAETLLLIGSFWGQLYNAFPFIMRWLPGPFRKIFKHWEKLEYFVKGVIAKHKEDLDQSVARDYIDCYLKEIEKSKGDTGSYFHEENLLCSTLDLFLTGTETTATAIRWALLYMATYPHIQEKVQLEINTVIGQSRQPTMADKENMPYTSAVLSEVLRMSNVVPLGVPRTSTSDTTLAGFHLPKGTTVMTSLTSIMFDKNVWETPDTFNPDHFLDNGQYRRREAFLPFSAGKRACPGEQLARTELFIFFTALLQKFTFQAPEAAMLTFAFTLSLTRCPKPFRICALLRD